MGVGGLASCVQSQRRTLGGAFAAWWDAAPPLGQPCKGGVVPAGLGLATVEAAVHSAAAAATFAPLAPTRHRSPGSRRARRGRRHACLLPACMQPLQV